MTFPPAVTQLYRALSFVSLVGIKVGDPQCYAPRRIDYIDKLVIQTIAPLAIIAIFGIIGATHVSILKRKLTAAAGDDASDESVKRRLSAVIGRYLSVIFLIIYLVLPGVTTTIAGMIPTTNVDPDGIYPDKNYYYMTNDLVTSVNSNRYKFGVIWASVMFFVYPVGIPCLYLFVLCINREKIMAKPPFGSDMKIVPQSQRSIPVGDKQQKAAPTCIDRIREYITPDAIYFLHGAYEGKYWYWELLETSRRLFLTALLSIVSAGTPIEYCYTLPYMVVLTFSIVLLFSVAAKQARLRK